LIQIITGNARNKNIHKKFEENTEYTVSDFKKPKVFEDFELNVLDLSFQDLWTSIQGDSNEIYMIKDLKHYHTMLKNNKGTKILVVLPQNITLKYYWGWSGEYINSEDLKNLTDFISKIVYQNVYNYWFRLNFGCNSINLNKLKITADFYFDEKEIEEEQKILKSDKSNKLTTIRAEENIYFTTLNLMKSREVLEAFLEKTNILNKSNEEKEPEWFNDIKILDDVDIENEVSQIEEEITKLQKKKENKLIKLEENKEIKSVLYQTGKKLQKIANKMLDEMLEYEDKEFIDEMEEDYRICKGENTFLIETKGLLRNVNGNDISKTDCHVQIYIDKLEEEGKDHDKEKVKGIFIVANQRNRKIEERDKLPIRQIELAENYNILIIRTEQLLKLYEDFRNKKIKTQEIIELFKTQIGEFKYNKE
jgi:hypothetical protein